MKTREEKLKIIKERLGKQADDLDPIHISVMVLIGYIERLKKIGVLNEAEVEITDIGQRVVSLCEEFDWQPSDSEIVSFCKEMVSKEEMTILLMMLKTFRDNPEKFENKKVDKKDQE